MFIIRNKNNIFLSKSFKRTTYTFLNSKKCNKIEIKQFFTTFELSSSKIDNKIEDFPLENLRKFLELKKINLETFKKLVMKIILKGDDTSIENLLLMLVLFNKNYPYFQDEFSHNYYDKVCMNIMNSIKLKIHYLYTSKMLIHTMNILINLKLIDNFILDSYMSKCSIFIKNGEYEIDDLICFLSIFSRINVMKQDFKFKNLKRFNWPLIKIICDKLTFNFEELFTLHKDNTYSYNLKKKISEEIKILSNDIKNKEKFNKNLNNYNNGITLKKKLKDTCKYEKHCSNIEKDRENIKNEIFKNIKNEERTENMNNSILYNNKDDNNITSFSKEKTFLLEILLSISKSLRDLKYIHLSLLNEVAYKLKNVFLQSDEKYIDMDYISVNKIFFIMQCYLFLQLDYHMFYKSILNTFKNYLQFSNNLIVFFFLLAKNKLFPSKTIEIFDSTFLKNINDQIYDSNSLIILLESYGLHKYRKNDVITCLLFHLFSQNNNLSRKDGNVHIPNEKQKNCIIKDTTNNSDNIDNSKNRKNENWIENKNTINNEKQLTEQKNKVKLKNGSYSISNSIINKKDETNINNNLINLNKMIYKSNIEIKNSYFYTSIDICDKIKILYCLFKLDIYEEKLVKDVNYIINEKVIHLISYKLLIKLLLSLCYFSFENAHIYNLIIKNLIKYDILLDNIYLTQLKICELSLRTQHVPNVYNCLNDECLEYINCIKNKEKTVEYHIKSDLQKNVKNILLTFNLNMSEEVPIGPYNIDFVEEDETIYNIPKNYLISKDKRMSKTENFSNFTNISNKSNNVSISNEESNQRYIKKNNILNKEITNFSNETKNCKNKKKLIIEVNGENHFYRNTKCYTSLSKLKHKLLNDLGYVVITIPYYDWGLLKTDLDKKAYIKKLISSNSTFNLRSILPLSQKNDTTLKKSELSKIKESIQQCEKKTKFLSDIEDLRKKNKLKFLKKKSKHI
ncbi:RAP protein, putative [Plasmodium relictum]|uniref:RAP protein, putative n=1 Tax=Plasmodium relictum TaxID=85471 RepID=A0A1J1H784_PLARL|nr:RAP protein, putative [Plasmodium relictum]CRH00807.1 RAP protein, putative [Plasmodium relictum]